MTVPTDTGLAKLEDKSAVRATPFMRRAAIQIDTLQVVLPESQPGAKCCSLGSSVAEVKLVNISGMTDRTSAEASITAGRNSTD